nr:immunoglobulin light chain junction region [Macaca mulatta]
CHQYDISPFTF